MKHLMLVALLILAVAFKSFAQEAEWELTQVQTAAHLFESSVRDIALSPDGTMLVGVGDQMLCVHLLATGDEKCVSTEDNFRARISGSPYHHPLVWSPDSTQILFHEDFYRLIIESDLWSWNIVTGEITNLTDDQVVGNILRLGDADFELDYLPAFAPNGDIYFFRTTNRDDNIRTLSLQRLEVGGDTPEEIVDLTDILPTLSVFYSPVVSPDGTQIVVPVQASQLDEARNGLWVVNLTTGAARQVLDSGDAHAGMPESFESYPMVALNPVWLADSTGIVVRTLSPTLFSSGAGLPPQNYIYVDTASGEVSPLTDLSDFPDPENAFDRGEDNHTAFIRVPRDGAVSVEDAAFVYLRYDTIQENVQVAVVPLPPDGSEPVVIDEIALTPVPYSVNPRMSADHKVLLGGTVFTFGD